MNINRIAFYLGDTPIYWYGVIMCLSMVTAIVVAMLLCKKKKLNTDTPLNIALIVIPFGIIGARLFACLFENSLSIIDFFNFRTGGMSIIGAIVFGGIALLIYCLIKKETRIFIYFDILCSVLILAQAIGRWGNYFNQELYGMVISSDSLFARFPFAVLVDGVYYQALFFYEFLANLIGFGFISLIFIKSKNEGYATASYLVYYGIVRASLELLRQEEYILRLGSLPVSWLMSIVMIAFGITLFIIFKLRDKKRNKNG